MRIHDGRRTEVLTVRPENGARGGTSRAQNTLCGVVESGTFFRRLQTLTFRFIRVIDEEGHDLAVRLEERLHIDNQVLLAGKTLNRLNDNGLGNVQILEQGLAR